MLAAALFVYCRATGRSLGLRRADRWRCAWLGLLMSMGFYGNIGAVEFISIGLTALLFFTFPPLIACIQAVLDRAWPAPAKVVALATAFAGLATMLGASLGASDPRGVALVLGAAIAVALNSVGIVRLVGHVSPLVAMFHMAVFGVIALQCVSLPLYFVAIARIGALKTAMLANMPALALATGRRADQGDARSPHRERDGRGCSE